LISSIDLTILPKKSIVVGLVYDMNPKVFVKGGDEAMWHLWQTTPGGPYSGWASEGGLLTSAVQVESNSNGGLEVFVRGGDHALYLKWQTPFGWSEWVRLGGNPKRPRPRYPPGGRRRGGGAGGRDAAVYARGPGARIGPGGPGFPRGGGGLHSGQAVGARAECDRGPG